MCPRSTIFLHSRLRSAGRFSLVELGGYPLCCERFTLVHLARSCTFFTCSTNTSTYSFPKSRTNNFGFPRCNGIHRQALHVRAGLIRASVRLLCSCTSIFRIHHPFLLSDNRHYTFYVWHRIYMFHWLAPYALVPAYFVCALAWFLRVGTLLVKIL